MVTKSILKPLNTMAKRNKHDHKHWIPRKEVNQYITGIDPYVVEPGQSIILMKGRGPGSHFLCYNSHAGRKWAKDYYEMLNKLSKYYKVLPLPSDKGGSDWENSKGREKIGPNFYKGPDDMLR